MFDSGALPTYIINLARSEDAKKHKDNIAKGIPFQRFGTPDEVANVALFLASEQASYVSGSVYAVDGASGAI